jgi:hypothetical protein
VTNCNFTVDGEVEEADAVLVIVDLLRAPDKPRTNPHQRWVFLAHESPVNTAYTWKVAKLAGIMNWSMTYRSFNYSSSLEPKTCPVWCPRQKNRIAPLLFSRNVVKGD